MQPGAAAAPGTPAKASADGASTDTTLVQQKQDVNTNIP